MIKLRAFLSSLLLSGLLLAPTTAFHHRPFMPAAPQANLNMALGNPSGATGDPGNKNNFLLEKKQYVLSYNSTKGGPNWVSWHLQKSDIGNIPRHPFHPEVGLPSGFKVVSPSDYTGSGYDRGHLCNAKDRSSTDEDNIATFSMANMLPQTADLNQKVWLKLEDYSRRLVNQGNDLYIIAGGYGSAKTIGHAHKVTVPARCWKIVVVMPGGNSDISRITADTRVIAVDMPNAKGIATDPWQKYIVTVRDIEKKTQYDFLSNLPKEIQDALETRRDAGRATPSGRRPARRTH
jgi:endonuclease G, mitochondrial